MTWQIHRDTYTVTHCQTLQQSVTVTCYMYMGAGTSIFLKSIYMGKNQMLCLSSTEQTLSNDDDENEANDKNGDVGKGWKW